MGKLRMATIFAASFGAAAFFINYMPLALPNDIGHTGTSRFVAQMLGATMSMANPADACMQLDASAGCINDNVQLNAVHIDTKKCSASGKGTLRLTTSTGLPIRCGKPLNLADVTLQTQFVDQERKPSSLNDNKLANFDDAAILAEASHSVHYENGIINQISLADQLNDHTIVGSAHVTQHGSRNRIDKAHITVFQNVLHLIGKSEVKNLTFDGSCCTPIGGSISTHFVAGDHVPPTEEGAAFLDKTEVLTFDGCGSAHLRDSSGHRIRMPVDCL